LAVGATAPPFATASSNAGLQGAVAAKGARSRPANGHAPAARGSRSGYLAPTFRLRTPPAYPAAARAQKLAGTVLLVVSVDTRGKVAAARVAHTSGHPLLDHAAVSAVHNWTFVPATLNDVPVAAQVEVPIRFRLEA
jgi:protein TonB